MILEEEEEREWSGFGFAKKKKKKMGTVSSTPETFCLFGKTKLFTFIPNSVAIAAVTLPINFKINFSLSINLSRLLC